MASTQTKDATMRVPFSLSYANYWKYVRLELPQGTLIAMAQVEHFNRTLVGMIKSYLKGQQHNWDQHLGCLAAAYWATPHESTGMTPNLLMFGRKA